MAYIQVYTGNGKGKSTAAFGLAIRAHYAGMKVYIGQFVKDMAYHETQITQDLDHIEIEQLGKGCYIERAPTQEDKQAAINGLKRCKEKVMDGSYGLVILDELTIALYYNLLLKDQVMDLLTHRHPNTEIVITGRYAPDWLLDTADLVSEVKEIKHYYTTLGLEARDGIER